MHGGLLSAMPDQLREAGICDDELCDDGVCVRAFPGPSVLMAAGMHLATRTVRSSIPSPIAIARSQAFNSPATRSRRTKWCFIAALARSSLAVIKITQLCCDAT